MHRWLIAAQEKSSRTLHLVGLFFFVCRYGELEIGPRIDAYHAELYYPRSMFFKLVEFGKKVGAYYQCRIAKLGFSPFHQTLLMLKALILLGIPALFFMSWTVSTAPRVSTRIVLHPEVTSLDNALPTKEIGWRKIIKAPVPVQNFPSLWKVTYDVGDTLSASAFVPEKTELVWWKEGDEVLIYQATINNGGAIPDIVHLVKGFRPRG